VSGDSKLFDDLQTLLGGKLKVRLQVGVSHWEQSSASQVRPATQAVPSEVFFAPAWFKRRQSELGHEFSKRMQASWKQLEAHAQSWVDIKHGSSWDAALQVYHRMLSNQSPPEEGWILTLKGGPKSKL
jgi:hypothetical protein